MMYAVGKAHTITHAHDLSHSHHWEGLAGQESATTFMYSIINMKCTYELDRCMLCCIHIIPQDISKCFVSLPIPATVVTINLSHYW